MGKIKMSGLVDAMSGKFGGAILSNTANGVTIRQNSYSQQPATPAQTIQRKNIGIVSQHWRSLSLAQKQTWIDAVVDYPYVNNLGNVVFYTGYQLMTKVNGNRFNLGLPFLDSAPAFVASSEVAFTWVITAFNSIRVQANENNADRTIVFEATKLFDNTNTPNNSQWKQFYIWSGFVNNDLINITPQYIDAFGVTVPNKYLNIRAKSIVDSNGLASDYYNNLNMLLPP